MAKQATRKTTTPKPQPKAPKTGSSPDSWMPWVAAALAFFMFATGFGNPMVPMGDRLATLENPAVKEFPQQLFNGFHLGVFAPLTWAGYALAYQLGKDNALWYHLLSALVHAANAFLVYRLFRRLDRNSTVAFMIALFFAIHPIQVEAVAWISAFGTPLSAFFSLLALNAYVRHKTENAPLGKPYWSALLFFALACLCHPTAAGLPLSLFVVDLWVKRPWWSRASLLEKVPFLALSLAFGIPAIYGSTQGWGPMDTISRVYPFTDRVLMVCHTVLLYWTKILAPIGLSFWYTFEKTDGSWPWSFYVSPVILAAILYLVWRNRERLPFVFYGVLFYLANILVTLPYFTAGAFEPRADHFNYLASLGIFSILAALPVYYQEKKPERVAASWAVLIGLGLFWFLVTAIHIRDWRDAITLLDKSREAEGDNYGKAYLWRGMANGDRGDGRQALEDFSKSIRVNQRLIEAYKYRGGLLGFAKKYSDSLRDFDKYLETHPDDPEILYNRALTLVNLERQKEALEDLNRALEIEPDFTRAYRARGNVRKQLGDEAGGNADLKEYDKRGGNAKK